jgi:hypothetical protein
MMRTLALAAMAACVAAPALAQETPRPPRETRAARQLTPPDPAPIREGVQALRQGGECDVVFTVSIQGKVENPRATCTPEGMAPYALRAMASVTYQPEVFMGETMETENVHQPFRWAGPSGGAAAAAAPAAAAETPPVVTTPISPRAMQRAINRVNRPGSCQATFTVGLDGKPKDIVPNCNPSAYNQLVKNIIEEMVYTPGRRGGQPVEWPNVTMPLTLSDPNTR